MPLVVLFCSHCGKFHSPLVKDRNKPSSEDSIILFFYKEARRLWALEEGTASLTRVQSAILLCKYPNIDLSAICSDSRILLMNDPTQI
jgi:hypothetical protein